MSRHRLNPLGIVLITASSLCFSLIALFNKLLTDIPVGERSFFMNFFCSVVLVFFALRDDRNIFGKAPAALLLRSLFGFGSTMLYFFSLTGGLAIADATILSRMSPFFVTIFSMIFLKEAVKGRQFIFLILALIGALLVVKPEFNLDVIPALSGFIGGIFAGAAYTLVRYLRGYASPNTIVFFFSLFSAVASIPFMLIDSSQNPLLFGFIVPDWRQMLLLLVIALSFLSGQLFMSLGFRLAEASKVIIYSYSQIFFAIVWGITLLGEMIDPLSLTGTVLIIAAALFNYFQANRIGSSRA